MVRLSALISGRLYPQRRSLIINWADAKAIVRLEGLSCWKTTNTPLGIKPASSRLVAQCLNKLRHLVILWKMESKLKFILQWLVGFRTGTWPAIHSEAIYYVPTLLSETQNCVKVKSFFCCSSQTTKIHEVAAVRNGIGLMNIFINTDTLF
jgi:hypothetical protein